MKGHRLCFNGTGMQLIDKWIVWLDVLNVGLPCPLLHTKHPPAGVQTLAGGCLLYEGRAYRCSLARWRQTSAQVGSRVS